MAGSRLLLLLVFVAVALSACAATDVQAPAVDQPSAIPLSPSAPARGAGPPAIRVAPLTGSSQEPAGAGAYRYRVEVPELLTPAPPYGQGIDTAIRGALQRDVADFVASAAAAPAGPAESDLTCTSRTVRVTTRLAVLREDCSEYLAGSPRPSAATRTFNCDLAGERILALQDLFSSGSAYLGVLSAAARAQVHDRAAADATAPVADNFRAFLLERDALVLVLTNATEAPVPYRDLTRYLASGLPALVAG